VNEPPLFNLRLVTLSAGKRRFVVLTFGGPTCKTAVLKSFLSNRPLDLRTCHVGVWKVILLHIRYHCELHSEKLHADCCGPFHLDPRVPKWAQTMARHVQYSLSSAIGFIRNISRAPSVFSVFQLLLFYLMRKKVSFPFFTGWILNLGYISICVSFWPKFYCACRIWIKPLLFSYRQLILHVNITRQFFYSVLTGRKSTSVNTNYTPKNTLAICNSHVTYFVFNVNRELVDRFSVHTVHY
jgi:hypothetical protein